MESKKLNVMQAVVEATANGISFEEIVKKSGAVRSCVGRHLKKFKSQNLVYKNSIGRYLPVVDKGKALLDMAINKETLNSTQIGSKQRILEEIQRNAATGIKGVTLKSNLNLFDSNMYKYLKLLSNEHKIEQGEKKKWFPISLDSKQLSKSQRELVEECLIAFHAKGKPCTIWDIMTITNISRSNIRVMIHRIQKKHKVLVKGKGDDITYTYIKSNDGKISAKFIASVDTDLVKPLAKKAWYLLQALDTIDISVICKSFTVTTAEAEAIMRLLMYQHSGEFTNVTLTLK